MSGRLTPDDVQRARETLGRLLPPTPLRRCFALAPGTWLKLECWQPTGSFKVRGALHHLLSLPAGERARGVVAASAGNHALGIAFAVEVLGGSLAATLFVPTSAPRAKVEKLRSFPVDVREVGASYDEAHAEAEAFAARTGARYLHAYDDLLTVAGQGTLGLEILDQLPDLGTVLVPVGGGGLITGVAVAVKAQKPGVRIVAVQPQASPAFRESLRARRPLLEYAARATLADGVAGGIGRILWEHRDLVDEVVEVSEAEIGDAMCALLARDQVLAEGSGALPVAALRAGRLEQRPDRPVIAVVTGANVDTRVLAELLSRP